MNEEMTDLELGRKTYWKTISTAKRLMWILTVNAILWIWCSYILAWFDKVQIAESLSSNVCNVVIGTVIAFLVTQSVSAIFRYNPKFGGDSTYPTDVAARNSNNTTDNSK